VQLRIEPGVQDVLPHMLRAAGKRVGASPTALFALMSQVLQEGLSEADIHFALDGGPPLTTREMETPWIEHGWDQAFWLHMAPSMAPEDLDDPQGAVRDTAVTTMLQDAPLSLRIELPVSTAARASVKLAAPPPRLYATFEALLDRLMSRRTRRYFRSTPPVTAEQLLRTLIAATDAVRANRGFEQQWRRPRDVLRSFGCWLELGVAVYSVQGLEPGLYRFDISTSRLELMRPENLREKVSELIWRQPAPLSAAYTIALFVDFAQARWRYRHQRALRNIFIELGRVGQRLINAGTAEGFGSFCTPAIHETAFAQMFSVDPMQLYPAYTITQGP
jgi:nitroreductase